MATESNMEEIRRRRIFGGLKEGQGNTLHVLEHRNVEAGYVLTTTVKARPLFSNALLRLLTRYVRSLLLARDDIHSLLFHTIRSPMGRSLSVHIHSPRLPILVDQDDDRSRLSPTYITHPRLVLVSCHQRYFMYCHPFHSR